MCANHLLLQAIAAGLHRRILPRPTSHPSKTERPDRTRATTVPISRGSRTEPTTVIPLSRSKRSGGSGPDKWDISIEKLKEGNISRTDLLSNIEGVLEHLRKIVHHLKTSSDEKPHTLTAKIPARSFKEVNRAKRSNE